MPDRLIERIERTLDTVQADVKTLLTKSSADFERARSIERRISKLEANRKWITTLLATAIAAWLVPRILDLIALG